MAATCEEGLLQVRTHQPDVLLLDQRLPDGLGTDLLPDLRRASPGTRVLMVTAADTAEVLHRALAGGAAGLVAKSQRPPVLVDAVRRAADGEIVLSPTHLRQVLPQAGDTRDRPGADLTARERQVLDLLADGASAADIAHKLFISAATARNHVQAVLGKLGAHSKLEAVAIALREDLVVLP